MNIEQLKEAAKVAGMNISIQPTGHPCFKRGFIKTKDGVSLGRAVIENELFSHIKWYVAQTGELSPWDYQMYAVNYALATGKFLEQAHYDRAVSKAKQLAAEDLAAKKEWRRQNPYMGNGKRGTLTGKSPRSFLWESILNEDV